MSWDGMMYKKYRVEHTDGTPLKGKDYFVLRLDSDNPEEVARVNAAMRAYTGRLRNCDVGTAEEQRKRFRKYCGSRCMTKCRVYEKGIVLGIVNEYNYYKADCRFVWEQMPYEAEEGEMHE